VVGQGTLALVRHDFREALMLARRARRLAPEAVSPFPGLVDALARLGEDVARTPRSYMSAAATSMIAPLSSLSCAVLGSVSTVNGTDAGHP